MDQPISPTPCTELINEFPSLREPIIDGLLRRGEVANIIAPPKTGKSFLASNLAYSVATGTPWLGFKVTRGRACIIDNELHRETLASRLASIAQSYAANDESKRMVEAVSLRGRSIDIDSLGVSVAINPDRYSLIVVDALYRMLPKGTNENDNAAMMGVYNQLDALARRWNSAIVVIHHSSKGRQTEKSITDIGAGAGSISRAADSHLAIRPHEQDGLFVLQSVTRSFDCPEPRTIKFSYPVWESVDVEPQLQSANGHKVCDAEAKSKILDALRKSIAPLTVNKIKLATGLRHERIEGIITGPLSTQIKADTSGKYAKYTLSESA